MRSALLADATARPKPNPKPTATRRQPITRGRLLLVRLGLLFERAWPALWPAMAIAGIFVALGLFDVLPLLDGYVHIATLTALAVRFVACLWRGLRGLSLPD